MAGPQNREVLIAAVAAFVPGIAHASSLFGLPLALVESVANIVVREPSVFLAPPLIALVNR